MNLEKLDTKTAALIVLACTAVVLGVLVIDVQIAKQLATRAQELDDMLRQNTPKRPLVDVNAIRKWNDEVSRRNGTTARATVDRNNGGDPLDRNSGMEARTTSADSEIPTEGWDVFPVDRSQTNGGPGSGSLAFPSGFGTVEPE